MIKSGLWLQSIRESGLPGACDGRERPRIPGSGQLANGMIELVCEIDRVVVGHQKPGRAVQPGGRRSAGESVTCNRGDIGR